MIAFQSRAGEIQISKRGLQNVSLLQVSSSPQLKVILKDGINGHGYKSLIRCLEPPLKENANLTIAPFLRLPELPWDEYIHYISLFAVTNA